MKHFLSTLTISEGETSRSEFALFRATDAAQAQRLNVDRASLWGGDNGREHGDNCWEFDYGDGVSVLCSPEAATEISAVTFNEMSAHLQVFGDKELNTSVS